MKRLALLFALLTAAFAATIVTDEHLRKAQSDPSTWLTYGKNYFGWRYSEIDEINTQNVQRLAPRWIFQTGVGGSHETTPLVFGGMMFITGPSNNGDAIDVLTGRQLWHYHKAPPPNLSMCCGEMNRGFAALGDKLFKVNIEATLIALDARTGAVLWERQIADPKKGFTATGVPLVVKNKILVGIAGAEFGTRGFVDAYDPNTGERIWRFYTVPGHGEPGSETWAGDSGERGGGSTWITGTYDSELNLTYWGTGNPGPGMDGDVRAGDNLYTCSLVALDVDTGKLKWYYQFTPHDTHDWDAVADPILIDMTVKGRKVQAVAQANRNGFFYALDRTNGKLLVAKPYSKLDWATGIGADGRPIMVPGKDPSEEGNLACPTLGGAHNWSATAYSPQTGLFYVGSKDGCDIYYKTHQQYREGQWYQASTSDVAPADKRVGGVLAIDPTTGDTRWRYDMVSPQSAGMLATAGGLVFTGDGQGYVVAMDARTGKPLWHFQTGGGIIAPPITYTLNGKQQIAIAAGSSILTFALPEGN
ncbi:MAG: PQQ-dependent dehydrogenase, methanol/ethanol family [Acidobacteria bacterium]|nr:MAG: PQQ-dependent dehydrogenase, methanol/ethanol family [Acidobacteriota bacterium]